MASKIKCKNCGAKIDNNASMCPYCGELNYNGAEKQYMEHLGDIKSSLEDLSSESTDEILDELSNVGRTLKRSFIIMGIIILVFGGLYVLAVVVSNVGLKEYESVYGSSSYKAKVLWLSQYEAQLNEMYANGEYDKLMEFETEYRSDFSSGYKYWKHSEFMELYSCYEDYSRLKDLSNVNYTTVGAMLYDVIKVQTYKDGNYTNLTNKDADVLEELGQEMNGFYKEYLGIEGEEVNELIKSICYEHGNYYVSSSTCVTYADKYVNEETHIEY